MAQARLLVGDDVVRDCCDAAVSRGAFYRARNAGKAFLPSTVLFSEDVEVCLRALCAMLDAQVFEPSNEKDTLRLLDAFCENVLPRFYQDALHVRAHVVRATFDRAALTCVYPKVMRRALRMKGGVEKMKMKMKMKLEGSQGQSQGSASYYLAPVPDDIGMIHTHRALLPRDVEEYVMRRALERKDGCTLLIAQDHFLYATKMACDPTLRARANEWAFAPNSPCVRVLARRFYADAYSYSPSSPSSSSSSSSPSSAVV